MNPGGWGKYYVSYRLILLRHVIPESHGNRGLQCGSMGRIANIAVFRITPLALRTNLIKTLFLTPPKMAHECSSACAAP